MVKNYKQKDVDMPDLSKYSGLSDFLQHAPADEQIRVFTYAAQKANKDQMKVFKQAQRLVHRKKIV